MSLKIYNRKIDVLAAARERMTYIFDEFEEITVAVSSGKDSTALYHLALQEAIKRNRRITVFFSDREAEYQASIDLIRVQMVHPNVIPAWYQVPIYITNSTSYSDYFLYAWGIGERWMREKDPLAVHSIDTHYPDRVMPFFDWYEELNPKAAYLVGLRADESLNRFRAVSKNGGYKGLRWSTTTPKGIHKFYPIYDWMFRDVWKFIYDYDIKYNKVYDLMYLNNNSIFTGFRVSYLIHEKSYKCLGDLPRFEPETYEKLCKRIGGISTAARYSSEKLVFSNKKLPSHYQSWQEFRDFLLMAIPNEEHQKRFIDRFAKQEKDERTYQSQVGQLLINDYENSRAFDTKRTEKTQRIIDKWRDIL